MRTEKSLKMYSVAVGKRSTPSPSGSFHIASHVANPTYSHAGKVVGPGPANPVGTRWMSLGYKGYGLHGTNHPESIGHAASHGCIRMRNRDVEELFEMVRIGDEVDLIAQPTPEEARLFEGDTNKSRADHLQAKAAAADVRNFWRLANDNVPKRPRETSRKRCWGWPSASDARWFWRSFACDFWWA